MPRMIGANTNQLRETATRLRTYAASVDERAARAAASMEQLAAAWRGQARDGALTRWSATHTSLGRQSAQLLALAAQLERIAAHFERAATGFGTDPSGTGASEGGERPGRGHDAHPASGSRRPWLFGDAMNDAVRVPGDLPVLAQVKSNGCWATVATMMLSWRDQRSYTVEAALGAAGPQFQAHYLANYGLDGPEKGTFLAALGLQAEPPAAYSPAGLRDMLQSHGPLWLTADMDPNGQEATAERWVHAQLVVGIAGDGSPRNTWLEIVDPGDGTRGWRSYREFVRQYEEVERDDLAAGEPHRAQIVHF